MKNKTKKIIKRFFAWLYVGAMSVPLVALAYHVVTGFGDVGQASILEQAQEGVTTPSAQLTSDAVFDLAFAHTFYDFVGGSCRRIILDFNTFSSFVAYCGGKKYSVINSVVNQAVDANHFSLGVLDYVDFLVLMGFDSINFPSVTTTSVGWALFVNFYINYLLNMSLILFMPEILMLFICWCRDLIYAMTDKEGGF